MALEQEVQQLREVAEQKHAGRQGGAAGAAAGSEADRAAAQPYDMMISLKHLVVPPVAAAAAPPAPAAEPPKPAGAAMAHNGHEPAHSKLVHGSTGVAAAGAQEAGSPGIPAVGSSRPPPELDPAANGQQQEQFAGAGSSGVAVAVAGIPTAPPAAAGTDPSPGSSSGGHDDGGSRRASRGSAAQLAVAEITRGRRPIEIGQLFEESAAGAVGVRCTARAPFLFSRAWLQRTRADVFD